MTIKIYRVENEAKTGIYRSPDRVIHTTSELQDETLHPAPQDDSSISKWYLSYHDPDIHFFGFKSLAQLKMWIHQETMRRRLANGGFIVNLYEYNPKSSVPLQDPTLAVLGDTQAIFWRACFTITSQYNLNYV